MPEPATPNKQNRVPLNKNKFLFSPLKLSAETLLPKTQTRMAS